ncbi:SWIM zinc finger family protein [Streptomyces sp. NPDC006879]|uniref:SWIM zinc finger family protein n=1 Tax=Streptomyces sp. NPDC006879 TaxID=3364767 RepID=UPI0036D1137E
MTQQGVRWTSEQVLATAPDDASRKAGKKLGMTGPWSMTGCAEGGLVWGVCKGSGSKPYQTAVDLTGPAYRCSCPSRKFPCKHALGLLVLWAEDEKAVPEAAAPEWAAQWARAREEQVQRLRKDPAKSVEPADPESAARRARRRAERIGAGVSELEQRLADLLRGGLAVADQAGYGPWEETAARMVDAQAPGLASRARELGATAGSGPGWPGRMLEESALLHLLNRAWQQVDQLPDPLAATVRARVGLPSEPRGDAVRDRWLVLGQYDANDGRLTTRRAWLRGLASGRDALVLDFAPIGRPLRLALGVGLALDAQVTFHAAALPLRVSIAPATAGSALTAAQRPCAPPTGVAVEQALTRYAEALQADPWQESYPVTLSRVVPIPGAGGWQLADAAGDAALPVAPGGIARAGLWQLAALSGGAALTVFGECGYRGFTPLTAWAEGSARAVPLPRS